MNKTKLVLSIIFPPAAVVDKGCGAVLLVTLLCGFFWLPGVIAAVLMNYRSDTTVSQAVEKSYLSPQTTRPEAEADTAVPASIPYQQDAPGLQKMQLSFAESMRKWLQKYGFHVGLPARDIDRKKDIRAGEKLADKLAMGAAEKIAEAVVDGAGVPVITTGGKISAADLLPLVTPFIQSSDLFGYNFIRGNKLFIVLFADYLSPGEVKDRVDHYLELQKPLRKKAGLRQNFTTTLLFIDILLVFWDNEKCMQMITDLDLRRALGFGRAGFFSSVIDRVGWQYLFLNVPAQKVYIGNKVHVISALSATKYREAAGCFYTEDLIEVLNTKVVRKS
jgi:uncharacterized membrane protein YqaE (UPF0057 family)